MLRKTALSYFLLAIVAHGQTAPDRRPAFDVASIKVNKSGAKGGGGGFRAGRLDFTNVTLKQLIAQAYDVEAYGSREIENRIAGGPGWLDNERYDVAARAESPLPREAMLPMAQRLLEERFQLRVHHETKEMPVYALVAAKNGPKFKASSAQEGDVSQGAVQGRYRVKATRMPMSLLASMLENQMDRRVVDKTGLQGFFDFQIEWALDLNAKASDDSAPSVFTAVQEQLGLRLESMKAPVEVIVIDRVEKPSEN